MDSAPNCSADACPVVVSVSSAPVSASQLYVDQFISCSLPQQCEPPHFQLHLPRPPSPPPPPPPQVQPLLGAQSYPQHSGNSTPGLGMFYNPVSPLVKREPRSREVAPGVMHGWHSMSPIGYRDRRLVQPITAPPGRNPSTPVAVSSLQHQHELSTRNITNNNHENTVDRKKSRRSGTRLFTSLYLINSLNTCD